MWVVGFVSSLAYVVIFFQNKFYADACMNVYYVLMSVYGFYVWKFSPRAQATELSVTHIRRRLGLILLSIALVVFLLIYFVLISYTDSPMPIGDAFTTALSIVGTWMLARKYLEHWLLWIVINFVSAGLYFYKSMDPTAVLYLIYGILSVYGYFSWRKTVAEVTMLPH